MTEAPHLKRGDERGQQMDPSNRWTAAVLLTLVLIPILFNAIMLLPELRPVPSMNDDAWQYLFVQRASIATAQGGNPFDPWFPELELGYPQFHYYQHLPHLAVVLLNRMLVKRVDLLTLFNVIRYLLLVGFPITVYWSMRTMEFSTVAAATGAAFGSLISANREFGFEYNSYLWLGIGMYTQLWAMHLLFICVACLQRLLVRGTGYLAAIISSSLLVLSHLLYAYMAGLTAIALYLLSLAPESEASADSER